jgi:hypothetical protein
MSQINEWLNISQTAGTGGATITLTASTNTELEERVASLKIKTNTKTSYVSVSQDAFVPSLSVTPSSVSFDSNLTGETKFISVISNVDWNALPPYGVKLSHTSGEAGTKFVGVSLTSTRLGLDAQITFVSTSGKTLFNCPVRIVVSGITDKPIK